MESNMDTDRVTGFAKKTFGKAERAAGEALGDRDSQAEGAATEAEGTVQAAFGQVKDAARSMADDAYDTGAEVVSAHPGSALLAAGMIGFALGVILTKGSQPARRSRWQRIYDPD
jgi:uncharacterized protein YjbJ (UPF0337 family)